MAEVRVTVLGSAGSHPGPARACSSYLVEHDGFRLLLDCGNGSLSNLLQVGDATDVDAILLSHRHPDHWADLIGLQYALRYHRDGQQSVDVYAPEGLEAFIRQLVPGDDAFGDVCRFTTVAAGDRVELGPLQVALYRSNHVVPTLAARVQAGGRVVAYTADSDEEPALVDCAQDADLLVCDCTWEHDDARPEGVHMSGHLAGELAARAGVRRLLVTHVWPALDPSVVAAEAARVFDGEIIIARDLLEIVL